MVGYSYGLGDGVYFDWNDPVTALPQAAPAVAASPSSQQAVSPLRASIRNAATPGPWFCQSPDEDGTIFVIGANLGGLVGAALCWPTEAETGGSDRVRANSHLIAAAPVMLATLEKYADQLCEGWCEQSPDCANFDDCGGCEARRIAWKAKGENQ